MKWDANLYEKFGKERLQPSLDVRNRIPEGTYQRILDIGCGSGMSTLPLLESYPEADIIGVDASEEMLQSAAKNTDEIIWLKRDCGLPLNDLGTFDLIFSNAFLQWLQNQEEFLHWIPSMLNVGGVFALQIPNYDSMPVKHCVDLVTKDYGERFAKVEEKMCHNRTIGEYYDILCDCFHEVTIWQTNYCHVMENHEEIVNFISATGIKPYLELLNEEEQKNFRNRIVAEVAKCYPLQKNGTVLFPFERIEWIARKE